MVVSRIRKWLAQPDSSTDRADTATYAENGLEIDYALPALLGATHEVQLIMELLAVELTRTADFTDAEMLNLIDQFRKSVSLLQVHEARLQELRPSDNHDCVLRRFHSQIEGLVEVALAAGRHFQSIHNQLDGITRCSEQLRDEIHQIESLCDRFTDLVGASKYLSINASVEASRAGELGRSFAIVADKIGVFAQQVADTSVSLRNNVQRLGQASAAQEKQVVAIVRNARALSESMLDDVKDRVHQLQRERASVNDVILEVAQHVDEITRHLQGVVMGVQFQDRVRQQLQVAIDTLSERAGTLARAAEGTGRRNRGHTTSSTVLSQLQDKFAGLHGQPHAQQGGDIELF
jgi:methyl-accepting chemotaxis protein